MFSGKALLAQGFGVSRETSISILLEWELIHNGGNLPVTYNITSCSKQGRECIFHPQFNSTKTEGPESQTLYDLEPMTTYDISIVALTSRLNRDEGSEIEMLQSDPIYHEATTRGLFKHSVTIF